MKAGAWSLAPGAVGAGRDINAPVTVTLLGGADDPLAAAIPSRGVLSALERRLDLDRFEGRADVVGQIDQAIGSGRRGYVIVQGEAGVGKTALAAHLVWTRPCAYHFTWFPGGASPENARRSLAAQLILGWEIGDELLAKGGRFPARSDDPAWLVEVLGRVGEERDRRADAAGEPRQPVVLVVDGLDEADAPAPGRDTGIPVGLPRPEHLPDGVFLVLTTRFGVRLTGARNPDTTWRTLAVDGDENRSDMRRYLTQLLDGPRPDPVLRGVLDRYKLDPGRLADTLAERCAGVWIYLQYVLEDLRSGRSTPDEAASLPGGLVDYYLREIERWEHLTDDWHTLGLPLLASLAAWQRPVTAEELAATIRLGDQREASVWLRQRFRPFLEASSAGDDVYQIRHQSLRDLFEPQQHQSAANTRPPEPGDELADLQRLDLGRAVRRAHNALARKLRAELRATHVEGGALRYAREHLAHHAHGAGQLEDLFDDPDALLACAPATLLRRRSALQSPEAHAGLNAYELSQDVRRRHPDAARWWLHVWARKTRADTLAARSAPANDAVLRWAWWAGHSHVSLTCAEGRINAVCALPEAGLDGGVLLASAGFDGIGLWNPIQGERVGSILAGQDRPVSAVCAVPGAGPDGGVLLAAADADGVVLLWDPTQGRQIMPVVIGHHHAVIALCALPGAGLDGGALLASAGFDGRVLLWDPIRGERVGPALGHDGSVSAVCAVPGAGPDGGVLLAAADADGVVLLWDPTQGERVGPALAGHRDGVIAMCAVPGAAPHDGVLLASAGEDGVVLLWDPIRGERVGPALGHDGSVSAVCAVPGAGPDGGVLLAAADTDGVVLLWDPTQGKQVGPAFTGHRHGVSAMCALPGAGPDGGVLLASASAGFDGTVLLWDPTQGEQIGPTLTGHRRGVRAACALPGTAPAAGVLLASAGGDGVVLLWDPMSGEQFGPALIGHNGLVEAMCAVPGAGPNGGVLLASGGFDGIRLWDPECGEEVAQIGLPHGVRALCALPGAGLNGGVLLASAGGDGRTLLWDPAQDTPGMSAVVIGNHQHVQALCALPGAGLDGGALLASAGGDGRVRLWDPTLVEQVGPTLAGHNGPVSAVCAVPGAGPNGDVLLASGGFDGIRLWDPECSEEVGPASLTGYRHGVGILCALPGAGLNGGTLLVASDAGYGRVQLWDPTLGEQVGPTLTGHDALVEALCALPGSGRNDSALLASGGMDSTLLLWQIPSDTMRSAEAESVSMS